MNTTIILLGKNNPVLNRKDLKIIKIEKIIGRGYAIVEGIKKTTTKNVLILHEDTHLPIGWEEEVEKILAKNVLGGFRLEFDKSNKYLDLLIKLSDFLYCTKKELWGDRALFTKTTYLKQIINEINVPLMEDVIICRELKKYGSIKLSKKTVVTSSKKFENPIKHTIKILYVRMLFSLGVNTRKLYNIYYGGNYL